MNERWLLLIVAIAALEAPRVAGWLAEGRDAEPARPWIVVVNDTGGPIGLNAVDLPLFPMDERDEGAWQRVESGMCAKVDASRVRSPEVIRLAWWQDHRERQALVEVEPGQPTFTLDAAGVAHRRARLEDRDLAACRPYWMAVCTKGLEDAGSRFR